MPALQFNSQEHRELNKKICKAIRRYIRKRNTDRIQHLIEKHRGLKVFSRITTNGSSQLTKLKNEKGEITTEVSEVLNIISNFYEKLYTSQMPPPTAVDTLRKPPLTRYHTEDIPEISAYDIKRALKQLKSSKHLEMMVSRQSFLN